jgi:hypothetical protein
LGARQLPCRRWRSGVHQTHGGALPLPVQAFWLGGRSCLCQTRN